MHYKLTSFSRYKDMVPRVPPATVTALDPEDSVEVVPQGDTLRYDKLQAYPDYEAYLRRMGLSYD